MSTIPIDNLFSESRFPSGLHILPVILYFPLGIVLATVRVFLGLHVFLIACILPKENIIRSIVLRTMCGILGIIVCLRDEQHRDKSVRVLVANHVSTLDRLAVDLVIPNTMPSVWHLPSLLNWILGYTNMGVMQGRTTLIHNAKNYVKGSSLPILALPEGASTNGKNGMLKFSVWPFSLGQAVQPIAMTATRPYLIPIQPAVLGGRWWLDIIWFLFVPYTVFKLRILPAAKQTEDESEDDFAIRIQKVIASKLKIEATNHTSVDKVEYTKRKLFIQNYTPVTQPSAAPPVGVSHMTPQSSTRSATDSPSTRLDTMAKQVQEVLPHIPLEAIKRDLGSTRDVDITITNILEGKVKLKTRSSRQNIMEKDSSSTFHKSPELRQLTFEERKKLLIANARQKYIEKHGPL